MQGSCRRLRLHIRKLFIRLREDPIRAPRPAGPNPNPAVAGILAGFFPFGVGAVYCSQYAKGLAHLLIFVMLIFASDHAGRWDWVFGIGIAFFWVYQIIDAVRTAHALQAGQPAPDPMGLGQTFSMGEKFDSGKVPVGAVVLIGLGVLFLLHTMGIMEYGFERFWPLILIFLGGWMFYRRWERTSQTCTCGRCSTRWLMGPAMVLTTGILFLLQSMDIAEIDRTWPAWILVVGVVKLVQSSASSAGHIGPLPGAPPAVAPPVPPPSTSNPSPLRARILAFESRTNVFVRGGAQCLARFKTRFRPRFHPWSHCAIVAALLRGRLC